MIARPIGQKTMKPRTIAMISNADQREPPFCRHWAPAQSPAPNSRAPYEPPVALPAALITNLQCPLASSASKEQRLARVKDRKPQRRAQGQRHVKKHYINVSDTDLLQRKVARDLSASAILDLERWRLLAATRTRERAARGVGAALVRFRAAVRRRKRHARWPIEARRGVDQFARIRMRRRCKQRIGWTDLDDPPAKHHRSHRADMRDDGEIVADQ